LNRTSTPAFKLPAFAKINWSLRILGRRLDGYHEIRTILQAVSLHDELHFAARDDSEMLLSCDEPAIPVNDANLILRAAVALRDRFEVHRGATIHLAKRIPAMGGLGGASSNAAIALLGLAHLWNLDLDSAQLLEIGATLGADVPFFLVGGCALATGIGTEVSTIDGPPTKHLLVVTPESKVATADAYKVFSAPALTSAEHDSILAGSCAEKDFAGLDQSRLHNDFEPVIFAMKPEIKRVKEALLRSGAFGALLAGSGSSVFGIFENKQAQERAARKIQTEAGWQIFRCVTLSRDEYRRALGSCGAPLLRSVNLESDTGA
jgi:4-diphosphocytidyl-2-C-methyl-D-erythritol kinase